MGLRLGPGRQARVCIYVDADGPTGLFSVVALDRVTCQYGRPLDHCIESEAIVARKLTRKAS